MKKVNFSMVKTTLTSATMVILLLMATPSAAFPKLQADFALLDSCDTWLTVSAGLTHSVGIKTDGTLWAWGSNQVGQLGNGSEGGFEKEPIQIGTDADWAAVSAGDPHTLALKTDGSLWGWGLNFFGNLGDGTNTTRLTPVRIGNDTDWVKISAGYIHSLGIKENGALYVWGDNSVGQVGVGTNINVNVPTKIGTANDWAEADAGGKGHTLAIKKDGTLWAWGANQQGQLGDGTNNETNVPVRIGNDTNWLKVSAGDSHSIALKSDGTLWTWGSDANGELGDGDISTGRNVPLQIGTDTDWTEIAGGRFFTHMLKSSGQLWAMGGNGSGQLGDNTNIPSTEPKQIGTDEDWLVISTGEEHTLAIKEDTRLFAAGANFAGQLGINSDTPSGSSLTEVLSSCSMTTAVYQASPGKHKRIIIYPNPAMDELRIEGRYDGIFAIYNLLGQLILEGAINQENPSIKLPDLLPGSYFIQITETHGALQPAKFMIR